MPNNGGKEEGELRKKCPFLNGAWCIGDNCSLWVTLTRQGLSQLGTNQVQQQGLCSLPALCIIMSTAKPEAPPRTLNIPPILRG